LIVVVVVGFNHRNGIPRLFFFGAGFGGLAAFLRTSVEVDTFCWESETFADDPTGIDLTDAAAVSSRTRLAGG
jgi:hypothetical protein